ncbi:PIG-L deacetylase family protein [Nocardiopsis chromatogenes]|uniref:PIG-L deacetylase family protein n=1 Tax=Nocardiopsis chromatogenes TaxID=280239 RepID=UPI000378BD34|nr:PIG-L family deacetylase [Nocardiopsis chromatogenes]
MPVFGMPEGGTALVIAPHPDDETLGAGGTLARLAREGIKVCILVLGIPEDDVDVRTKEFDAACRTLGVAEALMASQVPSRPYDLVGFLEAGTPLGLDALRPDLLLIPAAEGHHHDHRITHHAALAAARPRPRGFPRAVLGFRGPDDYWPEAGEPARVSVDISAHQATKMSALTCYASQLREPPHPRSLLKISDLDSAMGARAGTAAAEQFIAYRMVV